MTRATTYLDGDTPRTATSNGEIVGRLPAALLQGTSPTVGIGYGTGAGGTVTQLTSKSTAVTLDKVCGTILMHSANLASGDEVSFTLTNSTIAATDVVCVCVKAGTVPAYAAQVASVTAGACIIALSNWSAASHADPVELNFVVIKAVTS